MTTALVTGATGFIGRRLVAALLARGDEVIALARPSSDRSGLLALPVGAGGHLRFALGDVTDGGSLQQAAAGVDVVYHLAAMLKAPWHSDFMRTNAEGTALMARAAAALARPPVLVAVSSVAAAGPSPPGRARHEGDAPAPVSRYGRSKLEAEAGARAYASAVPITLVRPPVVFGPEDRAALPLFAACARGLQVVPGFGEPRLSMIYVDDLCAALIAAAERGERLADGAAEAGAGGEAHEAAHDGRGVYFAAAVEQPSIAELGVLIGSALERRVRVLRVPAPLCLAVGAAGEAVARLRGVASIVNLDKMREATAGSWCCDASKARAQLGFAPAATLAERLRSTALWYRAEGWI
jgi:dihydroflavonol-4-reductase